MTPGGRRALTLLCVAQFLDVLGVTVVVVALPEMASDLEAGAAASRWVVSAYALCFGGLLVLAGRAADLLGRRRVFVGGLLAFAAASLVCGLAPSAPVLLAARAVQGTAAAAVVPAALALLAARFCEPAVRARALAVWTAAAAGGGAAGFFLGGAVVATLGWRWIFLLNVPVALAAAALAPRLLAESRDGARRRLDVLGAALVTAGLACAIGGLTLLADERRLAPVPLVVVAVGVALLVAFVRWERRHDAPLAPLDVVRRRTTAAPAATAFVLTATTGAAAIFVTEYLQGPLGRSATFTGLAFLPFSVMVAVASLAGPRVVARAGAAAVVAGGLAGVAAGLLVFTLAGTDGGEVPVLAGLALVGAALGLASVAATTMGMDAAGPSEQGLVAGLLNTATQIGTAAGVALLGGLAAVRTAALAGDGRADAAALVGGFRTGWFVAAALALVAAAVLGRALRRR